MTRKLFIAIAIVVAISVIPVNVMFAGSTPSGNVNPGNTYSEHRFDFLYGPDYLEHGDHGLGIIPAQDSLEHRDPPPPGSPMAPKNDLKKTATVLIEWIVCLFL